MGWEVVAEVEPIALFIIKPLGVTSTFAIGLCYARRRGLGECIHDRCEIVKLMVYLRWQLKFTSGWIEAPGEPSVACIFGNPGVPCDSPMDRHPGSKGS